MSDRRFFIETPMLETRLELVTAGAGDYTLMVGTLGLGVPPVRNRYRDSAGDGGEYAGKTYGMRPMDLPIFVEGENRADTEEKIRTLAKAIDVPEGKALPKLIAEYSDGSAFELPFVYTSGLEGDGTQSTRRRVELPLSVMCPAPLWMSTTALSFAFENDDTATPFLDDLAGLPVAGSTAGGVITQDNPGDSASYISYLVQGPSSGNITVLINGQGWVFETPLDVGEIITITAGPRGVKVVDALGVSRYADMADAPKFPRMQPGANTIDVVMVGADADSRVSGSWKPTRKVVY